MTHDFITEPVFFSKLVAKEVITGVQTSLTDYGEMQWLATYLWLLSFTVAAQLTTKNLLNFLVLNYKKNMFLLHSEKY